MVPFTRSRQRPIGYGSFNSDLLYFTTAILANIVAYADMPVWACMVCWRSGVCCPSDSVICPLHLICPLHQTCLARRDVLQVFDFQDMSQTGHIGSGVRVQACVDGVACSGATVSVCWMLAVACVCVWRAWSSPAVLPASLALSS